MKGYTSVSKIENYLLITIEEWFVPQITEWIEEIEEYIDKQTRRNFVADTEASERLYDGTGEKMVPVDDFVIAEDESVSVSVGDADALADSKFLLYPANIMPKRQIVMKSGCFSRGMQNIKVSARWGYSETPPKDIVTAATVLVSGIINFSMNAEGEVQSMTVGRYSVTYKNERQWSDFERIEGILKSYKRKLFPV